MLAVLFIVSIVQTFEVDVWVCDKISELSAIFVEVQLFKAVLAKEARIFRGECVLPGDPRCNVQVANLQKRSDQFEFTQVCKLTIFATALTLQLCVLNFALDTEIGYELRD